MAAHAGDMLPSLTTPLHTRDGDLGPLLATTFAHPTLSEAVKVAVRDAVASTPGARGGDDYLVSSDPRAPPPVGELLLSESVLWSQSMSDWGERVCP